MGEAGAAPGGNLPFSAKARNGAEAGSAVTSLLHLQEPVKSGKSGKSGKDGQDNQEHEVNVMKARHLPKRDAVFPDNERKEAASYGARPSSW